MFPLASAMIRRWGRQFAKPSNVVVLRRFPSQSCQALVLGSAFSQRAQGMGHIAQGGVALFETGSIDRSAYQLELSPQPFDVLASLVNSFVERQLGRAEIVDRRIDLCERRSGNFGAERALLLEPKRHGCSIGVPRSLAMGRFLRNKSAVLEVLGFPC